MPPIDHTLADSQIGSGFGITTLPHLREFAVGGPFKVTGISDTPSRRTIFTCRPTSAGRRSGVRDEIIRKLATQAYRGPLTAPDIDGLNKFYAQGRKDGDFEVGHPHGAAGDPGEPALPVPPRGSAGDAARRAELPHHRSRSRVAPVVLPVGRGAGRRAAEGRAARHAARTRRAGRAGQAHARGSAGPKRSSTRFGSQWLRLQDLEKIYPDALLFPYYDYKLGEALKKETELFFDSIVREDRNIRRPDHGRLHVRQRARREALRHPEHQRREFRRVTLADENRRGLLGQGSILALTSVADRTSPVLRGKWIMEVLLGVAAAGAAAQRADARRDQGRSRRRDADDAPAHGAAPRESAVHLVPSRDRSARPGARELRRHRPLAHPRQRRAGRSGRRSLRRHEDDRPGRPARRAAQAPGHVLH